MVQNNFAGRHLDSVHALQEAGLARILLEDVGLETVVRINRPARLGEKLMVSVGFVDVPKGIFKFDESFSGSNDRLLPDVPSSGDELYVGETPTDTHEA